VALRQEEFTSLCDDVDLDRDRALVERCQAGDSAAFGNLYARYYERLLRFCLRRLNDRHEAEDAAQEAFARAWKALPRFAGDKRFYPWLTVIAGNICTDMLRRRSRSTPTDDMELTAQQPVGVVGSDTSEDLVLAAVDGELVNRALDRLSTRHRHVLAMREGSGWTYQQIADHEGVEIGTIETLLWRARQALKREFAVVSESKEALAGFLIATGALIKRTVFRAAHRSASVHSQSNGGTGGGFRDGLVGAVAVTGAAVAAAFVVPHALSGPSSPPAGAGTALAAPSIASLGTTSAARAAGSSQSGTAATSNGGTGANGSSTGGSGGSSGGRGIPTVNGAAAGGAASVVGGLSNGTSGISNGVNQTTSGLGNTVNGVTNGLGTTVGGVTNGLGQTVTGATNGLGQTVTGVTNGLSNTVSGLTNTLGGLGGLLGSGSSGSGSGNGSTNTATTTTTTNPVSGLVGGLGDTVGGLTGGVGNTVGGLLGGG
jgi:RNA polymerase sigma-70 factor (ECF subfamily)